MLNFYGTIFKKGREDDKDQSPPWCKALGLIQILYTSVCLPDSMCSILMQL